VTICLEPEQLALFEELLEAWRGVPRDQRQPFLYIQLMAGNVIQGNGIDKASVPDGDVEELRAEGLISFDGDSFTIPARSIATYQEWKGSHVEPVADVEAQITRYLDSQRFRTRYPEAYARWRDARVEQINTQIRLIIRRGFGYHSPDAVIALAMLSLAGLCPPLPGR
jgi:hypothetical protein